VQPSVRPKWAGLTARTPRRSWQALFGLALLPLLATLAVFVCFAKDSPNQPAPRPLVDYGRVLWRGDTWWFCLFYSVTFGGFVGLASYLPLFFNDADGGYGLSAVAAGNFASLCVVAGSFLRPVGGYLADRFGGVRMLTFLYLGVALALWGVSTMPSLVMGTCLMFLGMGLLGMGNGSVFQLVPQRFGKEIGVLTGIVGAAGGVGGFFLPTLLGALKGGTGSYQGGFLIFAMVSLGCAGCIVYVGRVWEGVSVRIPLAESRVPG